MYWGKRLFLILTLFCSKIYSKTSAFDFELGITGSTFPKSLSAFGEGGFNILLWGSPGGSKGHYKYGFLRPAIRVQSSGLLTKAEWKLNFFPISIFGITVGQSYSFRTGSLTSSSCPSTDATCQGHISRQFLTSQFLYGFESNFIILKAKYVYISSPNNDFFFIWDDSTDLDATTGRDQFIGGDIMFGSKPTPETNLGLAITGGQMLGTRGMMNAEYFFFKWSPQSFSVGAAAGRFYSDVHLSGFFFGLSLSWIPAPSLHLF